MTLIEQEDSVINTYATRVTSKELKMMSGEENLHSLIDVELTDENGLLFEGKAYICRDLSKFQYPLQAYIERIAETQSAHHYLKRSQEQGKIVEVEIWNNENVLVEVEKVDLKRPISENPYM